jgi:hypothetical protein
MLSGSLAPECFLDPAKEAIEKEAMLERHREKRRRQVQRGRLEAAHAVMSHWSDDETDE